MHAGSLGYRKGFGTSWKERLCEAKGEVVEDVFSQERVLRVAAVTPKIILP